jgi:hypothetical protein
MSTDHETTSIVRSWLRTDERESAARILDEVLAALDTTPQRRSWWPARRFADVSSFAKLAIATAAVVAVVAIAANLPARESGPAGVPTAPVATASPSGDTVATPRPSTTTGAEWGDIDPGVYDIAWPLGPADARIHLTVPAGWSWIGRDRTTIFKDHGLLYGFPADLAAYTVRRVVTSVCPLDESSGEVGPIFIEVGPTVADLTTSISNIVGTRWSDPVDVTLGGYPAKRLESTYTADCPGPTRRSLWANDSVEFFVEEGVKSSVYVVDVAGDRLVVASHERTSAADVVGELQAIIASIDIERGQAGADTTPSPVPTPGLFPAAVGPDAELRVGRHQAVVDDVPFSFSVPTSGWEPQRGFYVSKSTVGPQGAEGTIRWTTVHGSRNADPCLEVLDLSTASSPEEVAAAVATAPGVNVIAGPQEVTVGGRAATRVVLTVREDRGCDPAYFYRYEPVDGGALWTETRPGDTIVVWIVDVGRLLFIEGELHADAGPTLMVEMQQIVDSMQFE